MLVEQIMQSNLVTVTPDTTLPDALHLTRQRGVRHLLVVEHDRLVGIVSDRDLKRAMASPATSLEVHELRLPRHDGGWSLAAPGREMGGGPPHVHVKPKLNHPLISRKPVPTGPTGVFGAVQPERPIRPVESGASSSIVNGGMKAGS